MQKDIHLISFAQIGDSSVGYISVAQAHEKVPFEIRRVYWTYYTPTEIIRGHHSHTRLEQVLVAVHGVIHVDTEFPDGRKQRIALDRPDKGLYLPTHCWHTIEFSQDAVLMVMASLEFNAEEYVRDYDVFLNSKI